LATINAGNISVGRDFNIESTISTSVAANEEKLKELESKIKAAAEKGDHSLVKQLIDVAIGISRKVGEALAIKYLMG
jgi:hypothetical protein